jgi:hypothetical protein
MAAVDSAIRRTAQAQPEFSLQEMWLAVSEQMAKTPDFRGLRVVEAHLKRLERLGEVRAVPAQEFLWTS